MGTIVVIGGGELRLGETVSIDEAIVGLSGAPSPRLPDSGSLSAALACP